MNFLKEYFVGDYLRQEPDILKQASVKLIFNVIAISIVLLVVMSFVHVANGFFIQLVKNLVIISLFTCVLFYIKRKRSIEITGHLMLLISLGNIILNLF